MRAATIIATGSAWRPPSSIAVDDATVVSIEQVLATIAVEVTQARDVP